MSVRKADPRNPQRGDLAAEPDPPGAHTNRKARNNRPQILLPGLNRTESEFATELAAHIAPLNVLFCFEESIVEVVEEKFTGELDRFDLARGGLKFREMTPVWFKTWVERYLETGLMVEAKRDSGVFVFAAKTMSEICARSALANLQFSNLLPRVRRILDVSIPVLNAKNQVIYPRRGFNPETGIYCSTKAPELEVLPLIEALKILDKALAGFCWANPQSKTHAMARLLTPYGRGLIGFTERTPLWFYVANRPRAGKDYCAGVPQIVYLGEAFEDAALGSEDEETQKRITAALAAGRRMMHLANCQGHIDDRYITQAITDKVWRTRQLGSNRASADLWLPNECEYSISANLGLTYREDLEPRMRKIEFAFFEEDENKRTFENEFLHEWVKNNRIRILSAIHSCYHYWIDRGMPLGQTPFTSFPRWARIVGGVMICCGLDDPCLPHESKDIIGGDLRAAAMRQLFRLCYEKWQDEWIRKTDIYQVLLTIKTTTPSTGLASWTTKESLPPSSASL